MATTTTQPTNLAELIEIGWQSKSVKREIHDNFLPMLARGETLFPGIVGFDDTLIPEVNLAILAEHDMLFLGEKGQAKSRLMRSLVRFLDEVVPYVDIPEAPVYDDPLKPISRVVKDLLATTPPEEVPIAWWPREERYAERLAPGTKFADIIGEIDPAIPLGAFSSETSERRMCLSSVGRSLVHRSFTWSQYFHGDGNLARNRSSLARKRP